jgi:hypothetical protein
VQVFFFCTCPAFSHHHEPKPQGWQHEAWQQQCTACTVARATYAAASSVSEMPALAHFALLADALNLASPQHESSQPDSPALPPLVLVTDTLSADATFIVLALLEAALLPSAASSAAGPPVLSRETSEPASSNGSASPVVLVGLAHVFNHYNVALRKSVRIMLSRLGGAVKLADYSCPFDFLLPGHQSASIERRGVRSLHQRANESRRVP